MVNMDQRLARLERANRRLQLRRALAGTGQDRWDYCLLRSTERRWTDYDAAARQALRNYQRLARLAQGGAAQ